MYMTFAIASAILASTTIASQDFARRDAYPDTEALISQNAHLYARDAYASAYADAYHELSVRWADPESSLEEPYFEERDFEERDLEDHYLQERDETPEQRKAREAAELAERRRAAAQRLAAGVPQFPNPSNVIGGIQTVANAIAHSGPPKPNPFRNYPGPAPPPGPAPGPSGAKYPVVAGFFGGKDGKKGGKR
ncbi:hypothetical protein MMC27_002944 [Xylographa pallens]|nr:hypothetical protein [Xylographa pallens]